MLVHIHYENVYFSKKILGNNNIIIYEYLSFIFILSGHVIVWFHSAISVTYEYYNNLAFSSAVYFGVQYYKVNSIYLSI